jgi:hypothetical protein
LLHVEGVDPQRVVETDHTAIFLDYPFWKWHDFSNEGIGES